MSYYLIKIRLEQESAYHQEIFKKCKYEEDKLLENARYNNTIKNIFDNYLEEKRIKKDFNNNVERILER